MKTPQKNEKPSGSFQKVAECLYRYEPSGSYFALFKINGRQVRVKLGTKDIAHAKRLRDEHRRKYERVDVAAEKQTLSPLVEQFLENLSPRLALKTRDKKEKILRALCAFVPRDGKSLGSRKAGAITPTHVETFLNQTWGHALAKTRREFLNEISAFFKRCLKDRIIIENPCEGVAFNEIDPEHERLTPDPEQVRAIHDDLLNQPFSDTRQVSADVLRFYAGAGLGTAETSNLLVSDVDWKNEQIRIRRQKTGRLWTIPIFPDVREMLARRCEGKDGGERVFSVREIKHGLASACTRLGLPQFSPRSFRRYFITRSLDAGVDPRVVASWQGHRDARLVLEVYSQVSEDKKRKEALKLTSTF